VHLDQDGGGEAFDGGVVGEDLDDVGPAFDLATTAREAIWWSTRALR
jgi:hypothetical protein